MDLDSMGYRLNPIRILSHLLDILHDPPLSQSVQPPGVSILLNRAFEPSAKGLWHFAYRHLCQLRTSYGFAASDASTGLYATLFGRDSLWILLFLLEAVRIHSSPAFNEWVEAAGADIFESLCASQGTRIHDPIEEQPGKIIHEVRQEMDQRLRDSGLIFEEGRSYSGVDQTFLFVIAYKRFRELFPSNPVVEKAWPHIEHALSWIQDYADDDGDGLFEYRRRHPSNHLNQVWKDSFDSIVQTGFDVPPHPIAWIDVQAYGYRAFLDAAELYSKRGDIERAEHLASSATTLRRQVNEQFWLQEEHCFVLALDARKSPITMVSSNAAHALWAGIVERPREALLVNRLMEPDMMTRYGLRTLSSKSPFYAPFTYHRGSIWPFDNAVFAMGLLERNYQSQARKVIDSIHDAISVLRSPAELYIVLDREIFVEPPLPTRDLLVLRRPSQENQNQGWTAAALLYFAAALARMTGTEPHDR
jgi:glycogen debranching enzyme